MIRKSILYILIFVAGLLPASLYSQEENSTAADSASALSPAFMPVHYTHIQPHFFYPVTYYPVDTAVDRTHYYDDLMKVEHVYQSLGIPGQAHKNIGFDFQHDYGFNYIQYPYPLYLYKQNDLKYYDVKTSYTRLAYTFGISPNENVFKAVHAQKFRGMTAVVNLRGYTSPGSFVKQNVGYFSGDALIHYEIPSRLYGFKVSYIYNRLRLDENGGLADFKDENTNLYDYHAFLQNKSEELSGYAVNTPQAESKTATHDLLLQQYVNLKLKNNLNLGTITHSFQYKGSKSAYYNFALDSTVHYFHSPDTTADSLQYYNIINTLQFSTFSPFDKIEQKNYYFHMAGGIMHEYTEDKLRRFSPLSPVDSAKKSRGEQGRKFRSNTVSLFARTYIRLFSVMDISGQISYSFMGYNGNDAKADASISWALNRSKMHYIGFEGHFYRISPDYTFSYYNGNQYYWDTTFNKQNILKLSAFWTRNKIKASFHYFMLHQYLTFDENLMPRQLERAANIIQLNVYTPFRIKNFGFNANLYLQHSDNPSIQVPLFAGKASVYYIFDLFKKKMQLQIGTDVMFNTNYYADAYSPVLRQFYHQDSFKTGNYFYWDANLNIKIQRINIFLRLSNILAGLPSYHYFTTPYYPMEGRRFQVGINWRFYD